MKHKRQRSDLDKAVQPFVSLFRIMEPLGLPDERPMSKFIPGIWPDYGDLRRLYEALPKRYKEWRDDR